MRQESDVEQAIAQYADMIRHICLVYMKNESDTEDVFQDVFLKYALFSEPFDSEEHRKAWLIRVTINRCKDVLRSFFRRNTCSLEEAMYWRQSSGFLKNIRFWCTCTITRDIPQWKSQVSCIKR